MEAVAHRLATINRVSIRPALHQQRYAGRSMVLSLALLLCLTYLGAGVPARAADPASKVVAGAAADATVVNAPIIVFAAASLRNLLNELIDRWQSTGAGKAVVSYAGTSALARQIERGAPADLFISADRLWMEYLGEKKAVRASTLVDLARNSLVLIAPVDKNLAAAKPSKKTVPAQLEADFPLISRLGADGRLAMANPAHVPAGRYARQALESIGLYASAKNRSTRSSNVRLALILVARAETPLGIVYASDAYIETRVRVVASFAPDSHQPIVYPAALTTLSTHPAAAKLLKWLVAPAQAKVLAQHGFLSP